MKTLSDKREKHYTGDTIKGCIEWYYKYPDWAVKQFIKDLKEEINKFSIHKTGVHKGFLCNKIDELAGDKLI